MNVKLILQKPSIRFSSIESISFNLDSNLILVNTHAIYAHHLFYYVDTTFEFL